MNKRIGSVQPRSIGGKFITFEKPETVSPKATDLTVSNDKLLLTIQPQSVTVISMTSKAH